MFQKKTVTIGTIGAGYAAGLHASGFQRVCGLEIRLKTICDVRLDAARKSRICLDMNRQSPTMKKCFQIRKLM